MAKNSRPLKGARDAKSLDRATQTMKQSTAPKGVKHVGPGGHFIAHVDRKA
jgi:hypothetical protein